MNRPKCPRCRGGLDEGPVVFRCARCRRAVPAADLDTEFHHDVHRPVIQR